MLALQDIQITWDLYSCAPSFVLCFRLLERVMVLIQVWWLYHHWFFMCVQLFLCGVSVCVPWHSFHVVNLVFVGAIAHIPLVMQHSMEPGACTNGGSVAHMINPDHLSIWFALLCDISGAEQGTSMLGLVYLARSFALATSLHVNRPFLLKCLASAFHPVITPLLFTRMKSLPTKE